jgi:hypothetical protein
MIPSGSFSLMKRGERCVSSDCKFPFFLLSFYFYFYFSENFHSALKKDNPAVTVHKYQASTATGPLCTHLFKHHAEEWFKACKQDSVELRGKQGKAVVERFTGVPVEHQAEAQIPFTHDNFLNALVQFIVATDQVLIFLKGFILFYLANFFRPSELWRGQSFAACAFSFALSCARQTFLIGLLCRSAYWTIFQR